MSEYKIRKKDSIAIIPARKGSKRIPGKNIKLFYDMWLILSNINIKDNINYYHL